MKYTTAFLMFLLFSFAGKAMAQLVPYDSLSIDSIYQPFNVNFPNYMEGSRDGNVAQFTGDGEADGIRFMAGDRPAVMQKGDSLHVYLRIPSKQPGDSNAAFITLQRLSDDFIPGGSWSFYVPENIPVNVEEMVTILVPDTGFNAMSISVAVDSGGNSFWLDAITLVQKGFAAVSQPAQNGAPLLSGYPNPFEHGSSAQLEISPVTAGHGEIAIYDALGREVERVAVGELSPGVQQAVDIHLGHAGAYFARLIMDGSPTGTPLQLIGE